MENERTLCLLCAWRQACNKKFSMVGAAAKRCPNYVRDLTLGRPAEDNEEDKKDGS